MKDKHYLYERHCFSDCSQFGSALGTISQCFIKYDEMQCLMFEVPNWCQESAGADTLGTSTTKH